MGTSVRRVVGIAGVALSVIAIAGTVVALTSGPAEQISSRYLSRHTFVSVATGTCVESAVRGTATGTRSGSGPLVRWTHVRLIDPTISAVGYELVDGRCDHALPVRMGATLQQSWSSGGAAAGTRRSEEGPDLAVLQQFNTGAPVPLPDRDSMRVVSGSDYSIDGRIRVDARFATGSEGFVRRIHVRLGDGGPATG